MSATYKVVVGWWANFNDHIETTTLQGKQLWMSGSSYTILQLKSLRLFRALQAQEKAIWKIYITT